MSIIATYIWIDGYDQIRSKDKTLELNMKFSELSIKNIPKWNYNGSSTGQAETNNSEIILKPKKIYRGIFKNNILILCSTMNDSRSKAEKIFKNSSDEPWFGMEQEFYINLKKDMLFGDIKPIKSSK